MTVSFDYAILLSCALLVTVVNGMRTGAPVDACGTTTDIAPSHGTNTPQMSEVPYSVDLSQFTGMMYTPGQTYTITMRGGSDPNFRGFMIQGRVVADDSSTGIFAASGTNYRGECSNTAATHTNRDEKTSVPVSWTAPPAGTGPITFRYAFVELFDTFWANITTDTINEGAVNTIVMPTQTTMVMDTAMLPNTIMQPGTTSVAMPPTPSPTGNTTRNNGNGAATAGQLPSMTVMVLFLIVLLIINN